MSGGRLKIQHFAAGELIPALEGFDAVSKGTVEMNCANAYFWSGKTFAAQYFTAVPFGLNFQGMNAWLYHGGGLKLWEEVYAPFNLVPHADGQHRRADDRLVQQADREDRGLQGPQDAHSRALPARSTRTLGVDVKLLPGGEIFPALERGVIDAAEFVGPYQDRRLGLHKAAKFYHTTGWHETSTVTELIINKKAWDIAARRPAGDRARRRGRLQRDQPDLVRGDQRRGARRSRQEPGRQGVAAAAGGHRQAQGSDGADAERRRRQGPAGQEGPRQLHGLQGDRRQVGRRLGRRLSQPDPRPDLTSLRDQLTDSCARRRPRAGDAPCCA